MIGNKMTEEQIKERISQCQIDIETLEFEKEKLKKELIKKSEPKFGDIVKFLSHDEPKRIWLYDETGKLAAFNCHEMICGTISSSYKSTGKNIFTNNLLDLDS